MQKSSEKHNEFMEWNLGKNNESLAYKIKHKVYEMSDTDKIKGWLAKKEGKNDERRKKRTRKNTKFMIEIRVIIKRIIKDKNKNG